MLFRPGVRIQFHRPESRVPFAALLQGFLADRFEPERVRQRIRATPGFEAWARDAGAAREDEPLVSDEVLYGAPSSTVLSVSDGERRFQMRLDDDDVPEAAAFVAGGLRGRDYAAFLEEHEAMGLDLLERVCAPDRDREPRWGRASKAGIFRREHASLLIRSETTSLLIDPLSRFCGLPGLHRAAQVAEEVDAVFVSHAHGDHYDVPSLLLAAGGPSTPVYVPDVPVRSVLTPIDMAADLRRAGLNARALTWWTPLVVGDIRVDVLPFYGEQPTRDLPLLDPAIRSYGHCLRVQTPTFSALILVDSGADPAGDMVSVAERVFAGHGPTDVVLACLREFACPFFGGLSTYWSPLTLSDLRRLHRQLEEGTLPITTAGSAGIARVCAAAGARWFLPYAHGFAGPGEIIDDIGWDLGEASERATLEKLAECLRGADAATQVVPWNAGDAFVPEGAGFSIDPYGAPG